MAEYDFHELSELLPFREEQVDAIEMRMKQVGWKPGSVVTLFEGKILDGRHRYLAAKRLGIEPVYVEYRGDPHREVAADFVVFENCESRHLSNDEKYQLLRTMRKNNYWPRLSGSRSDAQRESGRYPSSTEIAHRLGVHPDTIRHWDKNGRHTDETLAARGKVREEAIPDVVDAMETGVITTKDAAAIAELPKEEQPAALEKTLAPKPIRVDTTGVDEWYTPKRYIDLAREVMGEVDLDPASCEQGQQNVQAKRFFTQEDDGLAQSWEGRVWMNPPYSKGLIDKFVTKLVEEHTIAGTVTEAIVLTHNFTDTGWFRKMWDAANAVCFTYGRVKFESPAGVGNSPTSGHVFFYFGPNPDEFLAVFDEIGNNTKII